MKKIHLNQLLRNRAQFNGVGQLVNATHAIQRALVMAVEIKKERTAR